MEICQSCGLKHPHVECIGIWHCPNALCLGSGGAWFRSKLDSYLEYDTMTHTVDEIEWLEKGIQENIKNKIRRKTFRRVRNDR